MNIEQIMKPYLDKKEEFEKKSYDLKKLSFNDLKIGDTILAFHSNIMTMSIPPQTSAFIIEVK